MISGNLSLNVIIFVLLLFFLIVYLLRKRKLSTKYALVWFLAIFLMLLSVIFPGVMYSFANFIGFELLSNMLLCFFIVILIFISLALTVMVSNNRKKITLLVQELSILKKEMEDKKWSFCWRLFIFY